MPTLLLVDGTALAYRAFHAIPDLTRRDGVAINALFGFARLLRQMELKWSPSHWAVVFDAGTPAARLALCPEYKAQRVEMPDSLRTQLDLINEFLEAAAVPVLRREGEEADDVMATAADWAAGQGADVLLATADKDLCQLVTDRVQMIPLTKAEEKQGPAQVRERLGVRPDQVAACLALTGDTADNIAGVPGIGPKTAARLLEQFDSLAGLQARLQEVEPLRIRDLLLAHADRLGRNFALTQLNRALPLELAWDVLARRKPDWTRYIEFLERMEMNSMAREAREAASSLF